MKISACYIVKNEAANIARSIESLDGAADEVIVVDTGSTDDTVAICEKLGARVAHFEWISDFAAARNHAVDLATGDVIIFLDADEWFEPKLGAEGREKIVKFFEDPKLDCVTIILRNVEQGTGRVLDMSIVNRLFANRPSIRYQGRVHEHLHGIVNNLNATDLVINHSGYSKELMPAKLDRNIALLEDALAQTGEGSMNQVRFLIYLVRECHHAARFDDAMKYLMPLFKYTSVIKKLCAFHNEEFIGGLYYAVVVALNKRTLVNRLEIRKKLFGIIRDAYPLYPGSREADLLYLCMFDTKEDKILAGIDSALAQAKAMHKPETVKYYKDHEKFILEKAAIAAWRRDDRVKAMEYAMAALNCPSKLRSGNMLFTILFYSLRGQSDENIILFFNSVFDVQNKSDFGEFVGKLRIDGMKTVYAYYVKKQMDAGMVRTDDYICMQLALGNYDDALTAAIKSASSGNASAPLCVFLSLVCGASQDIAANCADMLRDYKRVLDAFNTNTALENINANESQILRAAYPIVAFAKGFEFAEKLLDVYKNNRALCLTVKGAYCEESGAFDQLVDEKLDNVAAANIFCRSYIIRAMLACKRYEDAFAEIEKLLAQKIFDLNLLQMLLVVAEKSDAPLSEKAWALYNDYMNLYDLQIDLGDVARSGIVSDSVLKTPSASEFKKMSVEEFNALVDKEKNSLYTDELLTHCRAAAPVYKKQNQLPNAACCMIKILAHGAATQGDRKRLSEILTSLRNKTLAAHVK